MPSQLSCFFQVDSSLVILKEKNFIKILFVLIGWLWIGKAYFVYLHKYEYEMKWDLVVTKVSSQDNCNAITSIKKHKQNSPMGSTKVM